MIKRKAMPYEINVGVPSITLHPCVESDHFAVESTLQGTGQDDNLTQFEIGHAQGYLFSLNDPPNDLYVSHGWSSTDVGNEFFNNGEFTEEWEQYFDGACVSHVYYIETVTIHPLFAGNQLGLYFLAHLFHWISNLTCYALCSFIPGHIESIPHSPTFDVLNNYWSKLGLSKTKESDIFYQHTALVFPKQVLELWEEKCRSIMLPNKPEDKYIIK